MNNRRAIEFKDDLLEIIRLTEQYALNNPEWRRGQCLFNALHTLQPSIADKIRGSKVDPFYDNAKIPACWNTFVALLQGKTVEPE